MTDGLNCVSWHVYVSYLVSFGNLAAWGGTTKQFKLQSQNHVSLTNSKRSEEKHIISLSAVFWMQLGISIVTTKMHPNHQDVNCNTVLDSVVVDSTDLDCACVHLIFMHCMGIMWICLQQLQTSITCSLGGRLVLLFPHVLAHTTYQHEVTPCWLVS